MSSMLEKNNGAKSGVLSVAEYRSILGDHKSSEDQIKKRLEYLEAFCRNVAKIELENYVRAITNNTK